MSATPLPAPANDPGDQLTQARKAYREKQDAEANLARLRKYTRNTDGMKADRARHERRRSEADATLRRILGVAA